MPQLNELISQHVHLWGRLPAPVKAHVMTVLDSIQARPLDWCAAWDKRYDMIEEREDQDNPLPRTRDAWWETDAVARSRRRGKAWAALSHTLMSADPPADLPNSEYTWAAVVDAASDAIAALVAYDEAKDLLTGDPEGVKFLMASGNTLALLMYPATLINGGFHAQPA